MYVSLPRVMGCSGEPYADPANYSRDVYADARVSDMNEYVPTIGLEIHAELNTATKMFCACKNDPDEVRPNVNICPVCLAHPGALPVINREAVRQVLRVGVALSGELADYTEFDRKNYFYPDLPKGYQISQYEYPLVSGGSLCGVRITRVHLEEDTARSMHDETTGETLVDYNRGGVPLMELVTEPDMHSAAEAGVFARELQRLLRALDASEANMEKGEMRVEANVSVACDGTLGTKVEIKNLNSFRVMERAVAYEIQRQSALLEKGDRVVQETRGWDEKKQATFPQRIKEGSADYRYFPDPDLPSLTISELPACDTASLQASLPELPSQKRERYVSLGLKREDAEMFVSDRVLGGFFDTVVSAFSPDDTRVLLSANYVANDLAKEIRDITTTETQESHEIDISPHDFIELMTMISSKEISSRGAKDILKFLLAGERGVRALAESKGLLLNVSSEDIAQAVAKVCEENQKVVSDFIGGKEAALQYLVGQTMRITKGAGDPQIIRDIIKKRILG